LNALKDLHGDYTPSPSHQAVPANGIDSKYLGHLMLDGRPGALQGILFPALNLPASRKSKNQSYSRK